MESSGSAEARLEGLTEFYLDEVSDEDEDGSEDLFGAHEDTLESHPMNLTVSNDASPPLIPTGTQFMSSFRTLALI